ncbi:hypothetical protein J6590_050128 [Homalodisca vitripennis]|nr:hypothetical protein J6590_050128 [Homalodisca vitripennis]
MKTGLSTSFVELVFCPREQQPGLWNCAMRESFLGHRTALAAEKAVRLICGASPRFHWSLRFSVRLAAQWQWPGQGIEQAGECRAVVGILREGCITAAEGYLPHPALTKIAQCLFVSGLPVAVADRKPTNRRAGEIRPERQSRDARTAAADATGITSGGPGGQTCFTGIVKTKVVGQYFPLTLTMRDAGFYPRPHLSRHYLASSLGPRLWQSKR